MDRDRRIFSCEKCGFVGRAATFQSCPVSNCKSHEPHKGKNYGYKQPYPKKEQP